MINEEDHDQDGVITKEEFIRMLTEKRKKWAEPEPEPKMCLCNQSINHYIYTRLGRGKTEYGDGVV